MVLKRPISQGYQSQTEQVENWTRLFLQVCDYMQSVKAITAIIELTMTVYQNLFSGVFSQFNSVAQSCLTLCNPMDCSTPGLPIHHQLLEFTQTHVHWVSDATQLSHPLSSPSLLAFNLSQHQCLFKWVNSSHHQSIGVSASTSVLPMKFRTDFL